MKSKNFFQFFLLIPALAVLFVSASACERRSAAEIFPEYTKKEKAADASKTSKVQSTNHPVDYFPAVD